MVMQANPGLGLVLRHVPQRPVMGGLCKWLDAIALNAADGSAVGSWTDVLGGTAATGAGSARPTGKQGANGINGLPALSFSTDDNLTIASFSQTIHACFVVLKPSATVNAALSGQTVVNDGASAEAALGLGVQTAALTNEIVTVIGIVAPGFRDGWTDASAGISAAPHIVTTAWNGSFWDISVDRGACLRNGTSGTPAPLVFTGLSIGADNSPSKFFEGLVGEILLYNQPLTQNQIFQNHRYLSHRWGVPIT